MCDHSLPISMYQLRCCAAQGCSTHTRTHTKHTSLDATVKKSKQRAFKSSAEGFESVQDGDRTCFEVDALYELQRPVARRRRRRRLCLLWYIPHAHSSLQSCTSG